MGKIILFVIIPLILSIGIVSALPLVDADYMDNINKEEIDIPISAQEWSFSVFSNEITIALNAVSKDFLLCNKFKALS